jgi:hypothetical protein
MVPVKYVHFPEWTLTERYLVFDRERGINKGFYNDNSTLNWEFEIPQWEYLVLGTWFPDAGFIAETIKRCREIINFHKVDTVWLIENTQRKVEDITTK